MTSMSIYPIIIHRTDTQNDLSLSYPFSVCFIIIGHLIFIRSSNWWKHMQWIILSCINGSFFHGCSQMKQTLSYFKWVWHTIDLHIIKIWNSITEIWHLCSVSWVFKDMSTLTDSPGFSCGWFSHVNNVLVYILGVEVLSLYDHAPSDSAYFMYWIKTALCKNTMSGRNRTRTCI